MSTAEEPAITLHPRVRHRAVGDDGVLVNMETGRVVVVNELGHLIVQHLQRGATRSEIVAAVVDEFEVSREQAREDLDAYLSQLRDEQLIAAGG